MTDETEKGKEQTSTNDVVSVKGPGGFEASFRGRHLPNLFRFLIFLFLVLIFIFGYLFWQTSHDEHSSLKLTLERLIIAQEENTYVQTLTAEKREALNLLMPDSLRRRTR